MGVEYQIEKGFTNETHPALIHAPTRIKELEKEASDLEWDGHDVSIQRREIETLRAYLDKSTNSEYCPTH